MHTVFAFRLRLKLILLNLFLRWDHGVPEDLELLAGLLAQLAVRVDEVAVDGPDVVLEA